MICRLYLYFIENPFWPDFLLLFIWFISQSFYFTNSIGRFRFFQTFNIHRVMAGEKTQNKFSSFQLIEWIFGFIYQETEISLYFSAIVFNLRNERMPFNVFIESDFGLPSHRIFLSKSYQFVPMTNFTSIFISVHLPHLAAIFFFGSSTVNKIRKYFSIKPQITFHNLIICWINNGR